MNFLEKSDRRYFQRRDLELKLGLWMMCVVVFVDFFFVCVVENRWCGVEKYDFVTAFEKDM